MGKNIIGIIGVIASFAGIAASVIGNWADERKTEILIDEKIEKALAEKEKDEDEDEEESEDKPEEND